MKKLLPLLLLSSFMFAKEPTIELGLGLSSITYPDYIGSAQSQKIFIPFPYIRYRGEKFKIDRGSIKRELFDIDGLSADLSLGGSLPADSEDSRVREGMNDLDFTFEIGPKLTYTVIKDEMQELSFSLPVRAVFATDFKDLTCEGYLITPYLRYEREWIKGFETKVRSGPLWGSDAFHDYFYSVDEVYATPNRPAYNAKSGYSGYRNSVGVTYKNGSWWYGAFASHFILEGAAYEDSPLVERSQSLFFGLSFAYIFYTR